MIGVVGIGGGDAGEEILIGFAGEEIAVLQRLLAEIGEQRVAARVGLDRESARVDCGLDVAVQLRLDTCGRFDRSEEHTSELQSLMRISYAVFCLKKKRRK